MRRAIIPALLLLTVLLPPRSGRAVPPDMKMHPLTVSGQALGPDGAPIPGATIYVVSASGARELLGKATADDEGRYSLRDLALPIPAPRTPAYFEYGSFWIFGRAPGFAFAWRPMKNLYLDERFHFDPSARACGFYPDEKIVLDLKFEKPRPVTGRVIDDHGKPVAGAKVQMAWCDFFDEKGGEEESVHKDYRMLRDGMRFMLEGFVAESDADGRFALNSAAAERTCGLLAEHPDYAAGRAVVATSENPPPRERGGRPQQLPVELTLRSTYKVPVHVSWADTRRPAAGAPVSAHPAYWEPGAKAVTNEQGNAVLRVTRGKHWIYAGPPVDSEYVGTGQDVQVGEQPIVQPVSLALARGAVVTLRAVDAKTAKSWPEVRFWSMEPHGRQVDLRMPGARGSTIPHQDGELRIVVSPGTRSYGVTSSRWTEYRASDPADSSKGRVLALVAGERGTIEFKVEPRPQEEPPPPDEPARQSSEPESVAGRVLFEGPPPPPRIFRQLVAWGQNWCDQGPPMFDSSVLVDDQTHGLANVVVYLDRVPAEVAIPAASKGQVSISLVDNQFEPRVTVVRPGQTCVFTNRDPDFTNVHIEPLRNRNFNQAVGPNDRITWHFDRPESVPITIKSDLRIGQAAFQMVADHPWVAVTDKTGTFSIRGLPPGKYQFRVWHEVPGYLEKSLPVEVKPGAVTNLDLIYPHARFGR
jgi:protocatechuate 3,4-dioxygenase beta subunit